MNLRRVAIIFLLCISLACSFINGALQTATATSAPTQTASAQAALYVPPGCETTPPATVPPATELALPTPVIQANPEIGADEQLRVFDAVVRTVTKVYVYSDFNGKDWPSLASQHRTKIKSGLSTADFYNEIETMVEELGDDHSYFESPVEVALSEAELAGKSEYVGIGTYILPLPEKNKASIISVFPDSPAEHSGLRPHDSILEVDDHPVVENGKAHINRMRGPECSAVKLTVESPGQAPHDLLLIRHKIQASLPVDAQLVPTSDGTRVGYILLPSFYDETIPGQVADALRMFGDLDGLILDDRLNSGGINTVLEPVLGNFTSGTLGQFRDRSTSRPLKIKAKPIGNSETVPLVVLVGEDTASFGEIFAGVLKDSGRAKIIGKTTLGNVEILHGYDFEDGSMLWIAQETFDPAVSHADWETTGIVPDVQAYADWDTFTFDTDPGVLAAVRLLGHK